MWGSWFFTIFKRDKINEYEDLKKQVFEKLELWRREIKNDDIIVMIDYELCVGRFATYSIYIPTISNIWIDDLKRINGYDMWSISTWQNGIKLHCSSNRTRDQTTRSLTVLERKTS